MGRKLVVGDCEHQYEYEYEMRVQPEFNYHLFPGTPFTSKH